MDSPDIVQESPDDRTTIVRPPRRIRRNAATERWVTSQPGAAAEQPPANPQRKLRAQFTALAVITTPLCGIYIVSMFLNRISKCPTLAFAVDAPTSPILLVAGACAFFISTFVVLACMGGVTFDDDPELARRSLWAANSFRALAFAAALLCLSMSAMLWLVVRDSYNCIMPDKFLLHPNAFGPSELLTWSDIKTVNAECLRTKSGPTGNLTLSLSNGTEIKLPIWNTGQRIPDRTFEPIRAGLAGRRYLFSMMPSVDTDTCPPALYELFTNWRN